MDRSAKKLIVTPAYYAFRHYSQYLQPNATRIKLNGSTDAPTLRPSVLTQ